MRPFLLLLIFLTSSLRATDTCAGRPPERFRVLFLLDASQSMERKWGNERLWDVAKRTVEEFAIFLQKNYSVEMGLRVYGHNSPMHLNDCEDSKLEVPIEENTAQKIIARLKTIKFKGSTPLTYSLEKSAEDLGCNSRKNIIILLTDGYETCERDPCEMVQKLLDFRVTIKPLIIGMNVDPKDLEKMKCIGDFKNAQNADDFKKELFRSFTDVANKKSISIYLQKDKQPISATNIPFTIFNAKNNNPIATYHHCLSKSATPDSLMIGNYDSVTIKIHCTPPIVSPKIFLKKFIHNNISIPYPEGKLVIAWDQFKPSSLYEAPEILIYKAGEWIARYSIPDSISLMNGTYDVQLTTIPSVFYPKLEIKANRILTKSLPAPGFLSLSKNSGIHADLYTYKNNILTKCYTFQPSKTIENLTLLPGKYKIIYRTHRSLTIYGTFEKQFEIKTTDQVQINL